MTKLSRKDIDMEGEFLQMVSTGIYETDKIENRLCGQKLAVLEGQFNEPFFFLKIVKDYEEFIKNLAISFRRL